MSNASKHAETMLPVDVCYSTTSAGFYKKFPLVTRSQNFGEMSTSEWKIIYKHC